MARRDNVVIAGATGFVGRRLMEVLTSDYEVIGLSRSTGEDSGEAGGIRWRGCDLFSLLDAEKGLEGARYAFYLVHSMMPSARLTQGSFWDMDLIAADNFARAAAKQGVEQIIYLGGILPQDIGEEKLSIHLRSRLEVERTLASYGVPVTTLRAGLVLGEEGSSFQMLSRLVKRLPVMLCPKWTNTESQPIAVDDVISLLAYCLGRSTTYNQTYDIGGPDTLSYRELMAQTAEAMGKKRRMFSVPFFSPALSRLWVRLVTGAPKELVHPLIESLKHRMCVADRRLQEEAGIEGLSVKEALQRSLPSEGQKKKAAPLAYQRKRKQLRPSDVRSVQRMVLPAGRDAAFVAQEYMRWLPRLLPWFLRVHVENNGLCTFRFRWLPLSLLELRFSPERSSPDRQLFYIEGGILARGGGRGRFEFRETLQRQSILAAIHDFSPRLPWFVYIFTQAPIHLWVMRRFARHLATMR